MSWSLRVAAFACLIAATPTAAQSTLTDEHGDASDSATRDERSSAIEVAALFGVGEASPNVYGLGASLRVGFVFPVVPVYVGALGELYEGSNDPGEPDVRHFANGGGLDLGYDFELSRAFHLRPTFRVGYAHVVTTRDVDGRFDTPWIGVATTFYGLIDAFLVGASLEYRQLTTAVDNGDNSFVMDAFLFGLNAGVQL